MTPPPDPTWRPCPRGELQRLARRLRRRRRRVFLLAAGTAATAALLGGALSLWSRWESYHKELLTCSQVKALADAYRKESLSDAVRGQVRQHLALCPPCRAALSQPVGTNQPGSSPPCSSARG